MFINTEHRFKKGNTFWKLALENGHLSEERKEKLAKLHKEKRIGFQKGNQLAKLRKITPELRIKLSVKKMKEKNPKWKGDNAKPHAGNARAQRWFSKRPCLICGKIKSEIHHIDKNTLNNNPENIVWLCRKHHRIADINNFDFNKILYFVK